MIHKLQYYILHKPYGYLSQFTKEKEDDLCLKDLIDLDKDVYPVGRLDKDSEGLLLLTNDKSLNQILLHPNSHVQKTYWVQLEGLITPEDLKKLDQGVVININKINYTCKSFRSRLIKEPLVPPRDPPIRVRKSIPTSWAEIQINEGKNRQVRRMFAAIGFPVLRLIRSGIGRYNVKNFEWSLLKLIQKSDII